MRGRGGAFGGRRTVRGTSTAAPSGLRASRASAGRCLVAAIAMAGICAPIAAAAQDRREPPPEAVEFYDSGREHFTAGRYREAIEDLERALVLDPGSPTLVYNLARVNELLGELDRSIAYYTQYLSLLPEEQDDERARVEETIARLDGARSQIDSQAPFQAGEGFGEDLREPSYQTEHVADAWFWLTAGGAAAALATGIVLGVVALQRESEASELTLGMTIMDDDGTVRELNINDRNEIADDADNFALASDVFFAVGLAASVAATLMYVLRTRTVEVYTRESASLLFGIDGDAALVGARGSF